MKLKKLFTGILTASLASAALFAADVSIDEIKGNPKKAAEPAGKSSQAAQSPQASFALKLQAALNSGSLNDALALFNGAPASIKNDPDLQKLRISLLISAGNYGEASAGIAALEKSAPADLELKEMKMALAKASGNSAAKNAAIKEIIAIDPNNASANTELAQEQVLKHKYQPARNYYMKALKSEPENQDALFGFGQTSYYLNKLDDARSAFKKILQLDPNSAVAYAYIGKLYAEDENYKLAEENILKAIELDSGAYDFYMDLGTYRRMRGKFADAEKAWTTAIKIDPGYFLAYAYRAGLYDEQSLYDKALEDYRMVIKTNPKYYFAYESLGILAWRTENYDEARAAFEKAFSYYPKNVSYPLIISACMYKSGKAVQVKPFLDKVLKTYTDRDSLEYLMLRLYHDLGPGNAESLITQKISKEDNTTKKGKMTFYMALYDEIKGRPTTAKEGYTAVAALQSPMFFEYRLAEWKLK